MLPHPLVGPSDEWLDALEEFELHQRGLGRAPGTMSNRRSSVTIMARHRTEHGIQPSGVARKILAKYLLTQHDGRQGIGPRILYHDLACFWNWHADEHGLKPDQNPLTGIPTPRCHELDVPVLDPGQLKDILAAAGGQTPEEMARNQAIVGADRERFAPDGTGHAEILRR